jgi:hypothetical protein
VSVVALPVSTVPGANEALAIVGFAFTVTVSALLPTPPMPSVAVIVTVAEPAAVGVQVSESAFALVHPVGRPVYA